MRYLKVLCLLLAPGTIAFAQTDAEFERVRELNAQVLQLYTDIQSAGPIQQPLLASQARALFEQRLKALSTLIEHNPRQALLVAFSPDLVELLAAAFPQLKAKLESHGDWQGAADYIIEDAVGFTSSKQIVRLATGTEKPFLHFAVSEVPDFASGYILGVHGVRAGERIAVEEVHVVAQAQPGCSATGPQNIAVILVNLKDYPLVSISPDVIRGAMLGNSGSGQHDTPDRSVDDFWQQNSDGKTWIDRTTPGALTVVGPYNLPGNYDEGTCDYYALLTDAWKAADADLDYTKYSRTYVVFQQNASCGSWAGLATVACSSFNCPGDGVCNYTFALAQAQYASTRGSAFFVAVHELGHNLGLGHASSRYFEGEPLGPPGVSGSISEYNDVFSAMGFWNYGLYNADHGLQYLGWLLPGTNYLDVSKNGSYSIQSYESRPAGMKALRIHRPTELSFPDSRYLAGDIIVEFRRNLGIYDSSLQSQVFGGALIHFRDIRAGRSTHLLDMTPETATFSDPALPVGRTWTDPYTNLSIKADSIVNDTLNLTVTYGTVPPCSNRSPGLTITPNNPTTMPGTAANFQFTLKNQDAWNCQAPGHFDWVLTLPAGWSGNRTWGSMGMDPNLSITDDLAITPPAGTPVGTYPLRITATNRAGGYTATLDFTCTVATAKPAAPVLVSPLNDATGVSLTPTLTWKASPGAAVYHVHFDDMFVTNITGTTYSPGTLLPNTTHRWNVLAYNDFGSTASVWRTFTTQGTLQPPGTPVGPVPANNAINVSLTPTLKWKAADRAESYDVYLGRTTVPAFVANVTTPSYTPGPRATGVKLYWKVVAKNAAGSTSSAVWSFKTKLSPEPPANPVPANGAINVSRTPALQWNTAIGATQYLVYLGTVTVPPQVGKTTATTFKPSATLAAKKKYYWRVVAVSATGKQSSPTWSFTTK